MTSPPKSTPAAPRPAARIEDSRPWEQPWWKPSEGNLSTFVFLIALHALGIAGLVLYPIPSRNVVLVAAPLMLLGGLAITVVYHRAIAHRALKLNPVLEQILIFF